MLWRRGALLGGHPKSNELARALFAFKDVFLVGFFLSVGLTGLPTWETVGIAAVLLLIVPLKGVLFVGLAMLLRLRARSSLLLGASLAQLSEFGLIVLTSLVAQGVLQNTWLVGFAIALAASYVLSSPLNAASFRLYRRVRHRLVPLERRERIPDEEPVDASRAEILIFGMGRLGIATHDALVTRCNYSVVAFDLDPEVVARERARGRQVHLGSATDADLWERLHLDRDRIQWVVLTVPTYLEQVTALAQLQRENIPARVAVTARYPDEMRDLAEKGADLSVLIYSEAGTGFASHILDADAKGERALAAQTD